MARDSRYDQFKKNKSPRLRELRHLAEWAVLAGLEALARNLSIPRAQALGRALGRAAMRTAAKDAAIARFQLEFSFPELALPEREAILQQTFENAGQCLFETLLIDRFRAERETWIQVEGQEVMTAALAQNKGVILIFGHLGNWELLPLVYEQLNIQGFAIESPIGEEKLDRFLGAKRQSPNIEMIPRGETRGAKAMLKAFKNNQVMLFALDQDMKVQSHFVPFFGRPAASAKGAAHLAAKFGAPVLSAFGWRLPGGQHQYQIQLLSQAPYQGGLEEEIALTARYTQAIEHQIRRFPGQWVWFHRRWKTQPEPEPR